MTEEQILVVCDDIAEPENHILQIISKAGELAAQNKCGVCVICPANWKYEEYQKLIGYGADEVIAPESGKMQIRSYCDYIAKVIGEKKVIAVLYPANSFGKSVAARLSVRLGAGLTADCVEIGYDEQGKIWVQRAAMNDSVLARIKCINCDISMCTVKADVFQISLGKRCIFCRKFHIVKVSAAPNGLCNKRIGAPNAGRNGGTALLQFFPKQIFLRHV